MAAERCTGASLDLRSKISHLEQPQLISTVRSWPRVLGVHLQYPTKSLAPDACLHANTLAPSVHLLRGLIVIIKYVFHGL